MFDRQRMLDAHVAFALQRWQGEALRTMVEEEVAALFAWLETVTLYDVAPPAQVMGFVERVVIAGPLAPGVLASLRESVQVLFELLREEPTSLTALLPRPLYDQLAASVIGMEGLRREVTHQVVTSSVYTSLISNILYHGIKDFMLTENAIAKRIPGASSLVKFGQSALSNAAPQVEKSIDKRLIAFIHANLQETVHESERFLNGALDEATLRAVADEIWATNGATTLATLAAYTDAAAVEGAVELVVAWWRHLRQTPLFLETVQVLVRNFYLRHGKASVRALLAELGVSPERVAAELHQMTAASVAAALQSGYLEQRIRVQLEAFYSTYDPS